MFAKCLMLLVLATAIGAATLSLRQQRLATMHEMVQFHRQMDGSRRDLWRLQVQIAKQTQPQELRRQIDKAKLKLEPLMPGTPALGNTLSASAQPVRGD